jgi:hypothetical protein
MSDPIGALAARVANQWAQQAAQQATAGGDKPGAIQVPVTRPDAPQFGDLLTRRPSAPSCAASRWSCTA